MKNKNINSESVDDLEDENKDVLESLKSKIPKK